MRILYFTRDYTPHDHRFVTSLVESGQDVLYLRLERSLPRESGQALEERALPPAVQQIAWRGGQGPFRWRDVPGLALDLRRVLRESHPDVVHAGPIQTCAFVAALAGARPLVSMSWGSDLLKDADRSAWYRQVTRFTLGRSAVLVGDCRAVEDKAAALGFPRQRAFIFPWGIDLDRFSPPESSPEAAREARELRARLGWQDQFVVLSLRSWEPIYGVDVMLRGFASAARRSPNLRLLLLGGGSQAPLVNRIIEENNLRGCVHLGGRVNQHDLPALYRAADLYVSASHSDGSSVSLMEALGSGLPVVVSDIPGNREWVTEGVQGWFFPDGDDAALGSAILGAAGRPEALVAARCAARRRAEQSADWRKNFLVLLEAYRHAAGRGGLE